MVALETSNSTEQQRVRELVARLEALYPDAKCSLDFSSPWELLVATMLSAQCTDERVNMVTLGLFRRFPTIQAFADAPIEEIEDAVRSTGFFRNKAKNIQATARLLLSNHEGAVPRSMETMVGLPGVARKTANCVLGNAYDIVEGIAVDTHVGRLGQRLGLTDQSDPVKVEQELMKVLPKEKWLATNHLLIYHGRAICQARKPACHICTLVDLCPTGRVRA